MHARDAATDTDSAGAQQTATKFIASKCRSAGILNMFGEEGSTNVQGEHVKKVSRRRRLATASRLG